MTRQRIAAVLTALRNTFQRDFWWAEFFGAFGLVGFALVCLVSPDALSQTNFWPLLRVAPEIVWERAAFLIGFLQLFGLALDNRSVRAGIAFLSAGLVGSIFANFLHLGHWPPPAIGFYFAGFCCNCMALWKNIVNRKGTA
jgi:hypothetical protein